MDALMERESERERGVDPHAELALAAADGDLTAMRRLLDAVAPRVLRVVRSVLGAACPDAEDVAQESLIALVRALPAFRGECPAGGYAARIAVRTAIAARKRSSWREQRLRDLPREEAEIEPPAAERFAAELRRRLMRELLLDLPAGQAEALALRVVLGCSLEEIASATSTPLNTVRSRLRLAKQALKQRIEDDPELADRLEVV